jgi:hypothetical protein
MDTKEKYRSATVVPAQLRCLQSHRGSGIYAIEVVYRLQTRGTHSKQSMRKN